MPLVSHASGDNALAGVAAGSYVLLPVEGVLFLPPLVVLPEVVLLLFVYVRRYNNQRQGAEREQGPGDEQRG